MTTSYDDKVTVYRHPIRHHRPPVALSAVSQISHHFLRAWLRRRQVASQHEFFRPVASSTA
jgi:hypothetical protein